MIVAYSFEGLLIVGLLVICTCAYMKRVPKLKQWFLSEKKGFLGVFYKGVYKRTLLYSPPPPINAAIDYRELTVIYMSLEGSTEMI